MRLRVVQLGGLDPAQVVEVARPLVVGRRLGEHRLGDQLVGLLVQVTVQVGSQKAVDKNSLTFVVVPQSGGSQSGVKNSAGGRGEMSALCGFTSQ